MKCSECGNKLYPYKDERWTVSICWICGYYESNSPAYKSNPQLFSNMVRENPIYFLNKFCKSDEKLQRHNSNLSDGDDTEPSIERYIRFRTVVKICLI